MRKIIWMSVLFLTSIRVLGQQDSINMQYFINRISPSEAIFIHHLKNSNIDSCMIYFSSSIVKQYGKKKLKNELKKLSIFYKDSTDVKQSLSINKKLLSTGACVAWEIEFISSYVFYGSSGKYIIDGFSLYYDDKAPIGLIKYFLSKDLDDSKKLKKRMKRKREH